MSEENTKTPAKSETVTVSKADYSTMSVSQLVEEKSKKFLSLYDLKTIDEQINKQGGEKEDDAAIVGQMPPQKDKKKKRGDPPKPKDIVEAIYNDIMIKYTYNFVRFMADWGDQRGENYWRNHQAAKEKKRAKYNLEKDETYTFANKLIKNSINTADKTKKEMEDFSGFETTAALIREGRIDDISPDLMNPKTKKFLKDLDPDYRDELFNEAHIKKVQKQFAQNDAYEKAFAEKYAAVKLAEMKMKNKDAPRVTNKTDQEVSEFKKELALEARVLFREDINATASLGKDVNVRSRRLMGWMDSALDTSLANLTKGNYHERGDTYKENQHFQKFEEDIKKRREEMQQLASSQKITLLEASMKDNVADAAIMSAMLRYDGDKKATEAEKLRNQEKKKQLEKIREEKRNERSSQNQNNNNNNRPPEGRDGGR